jgi:hypothetical protein
MAKRKGFPTSEELLYAVPFTNEAMNLEPKGRGAIVEVPMRRPRWLFPPFCWIIPFSAMRRIELDPIGYSVLQQVDGKRTSEKIIETFSKIHKLSFREAQLPVTQFLQQLSERGVIAIVGFKGAPPHDAT